jgi:pilus assembly protein CpaF
MSLQDRLGQRVSSQANGALQERIAAASDAFIVPVSAVPVTSVLSNSRRNSRRAYDPLAAVRRRAHEALLELLGPQLYETVTDDEELARKVRETLPEVLSREEVPLAATDRALAFRQILDEILGHGPIEPMLRDPEITEIMVNAWDRIYVERYGHIHEADAAFMDEQHLRRVIDKIVSRIGRRIDESSPMVDARLPDGSRINAVVPPLALDGSLLTIRKFAIDPYTHEDLIGFGSMTRALAEFLNACVRGRLNILVSGGTGAGKTTTLNVLSDFIPEDERIITIEDAAELQLHQEHVVRLEARPPNIEGRGEIRIRDLVRNALRMRPDRIVVGEVRDSAALDMLQAMNTGHDGSICTIHANSPRDVLSRVETMVLMAGMDLPVRAIREQVASAIDLIVHQQRFKDGTRRVTYVTEVVGMESETITLQEIFRFDFGMGLDSAGRSLGELKPTGLRPHFMPQLEANGIWLDPALFAYQPFYIR